MGWKVVVYLLALNLLSLTLKQILIKKKKNSDADFDELKINYFSSVSADICSDKLFLISSLDGEHIFSDIQSSVRWIFIFFIWVSFTNFAPSFLL